MEPTPRPLRGARQLDGFRLNRKVNNMRITRALILLSAITLLGSVHPSRGQQTADPPLAPVPTQILTAKKVFISNASGVTDSAKAAPDLPYNEFYAAMKSWGRYELVGAPGDADLVLELQYVIVLGAASFRGEGGTIQDPKFTLRILDPKSGTILWAFTEPLRKTGKQTGRQIFDAALAKIVDDVKKLSQPADTSLRPNS